MRCPSCGKHTRCQTDTYLFHATEVNVGRRWHVECSTGHKCVKSGPASHKLGAMRLGSQARLPRDAPTGTAAVHCALRLLFPGCCTSRGGSTDCVQL